MVGLTFRNSDDCFYSSGASFVPRLTELVAAVRGLTDAPVVIGGGGFSVFPQAVLEASGADFGIRGDGEAPLPRLLEALDGGEGLEEVPGLVRRSHREGRVRSTPNPAEPGSISLAPTRELMDNARYLREGGQVGLETKRGCDRRCTFCADPLIKGRRIRTRPPTEVAEEAENLLEAGVDVLHLCDSEFNVPLDHALAVCREFARRGLGDRLRWYTYAAVTAFTDELARAMHEAGCVGVNFGVDSASAEMLETYGRRHRADDIRRAVELCRRNGLRVMLDLMLGGPGETEETVRETVQFTKRIGPNCVGAALGVRLYPGTALARDIVGKGSLRANPNVEWKGDPELRRRARELGRDGQLLAPVFYVSRELGDDPAALICDLIDGDERFFEPVSEQTEGNYNYNENRPLIEAIQGGARGAYWDILRRTR